jgi:hypothetical protein
MPGQPYPGVAPPKKGRGGKIALIIGAVALVLLCGCGIGAIWFFNEVGDEISDQIDALPSIGATSPAGAPTTSADEEDFNKGDCVVNEGTDTSPELKKVPCAAGAFEVVAEIPFTTDEARCDNEILGAGKGKYDSTYTYDQQPGALGDYVLCLKKR